MDETKELEPGSVIGNYRIVRLLGQGGMGTVYEVEHLELGTRYALKTFTFDPENDASNALKKKFLEEGRLLARLKHPNLTHVFDLAFEESTQMPYFVMDLVTYEDGCTYTVEDIELEDIDEEMVYTWFVQLASALDYIHGEGIVHRDIKPSNLLVDKDLKVVLTDFGISRIFGAKIKSEVDATRTMVTKTGRGKLVLGTEHYIAPEVAAGEDATPKADAYSLGVMLIRWLTGFYYGDNPGAIALLSRKKYNWVPVISRLIAPATRRPDNYSELVKMLKIAEVPAAKPTSPAKKKRAKTKENLSAVLIGLLIAGVLCGIGYFGWEMYQRTEENKRQQQAQMLAMQKQLEEVKAEGAPGVVTNTTVVKVVEKVKVVESEKKPVVEERREPFKTVAKPTPKPEAKKPEKKPEFRVVAKLEDIPEKKDYGQIPELTYRWLKGGNKDSPQSVTFELANGAKMELVPLKAGTFYMSNLDGDGRAKHKVSITQPFWMSKYSVTLSQWREYAPNDSAELRRVEDAVGLDKPVSTRYSRSAAESFCKMLTAKYKSQLPKDYIFRLPTEAEWEYAMDVDGTRKRYGRDFDDVYTHRYKDAFERLRKDRKLDDICRWHTDWAHICWNDRSRVFVGGFAKPMESGVCDMLASFWNHGSYTWVLDTYKVGEEITYAAEETDPLHWAGALPSSGVLGLARGCMTRRMKRGNGDAALLRIVVGRDLVADKSWMKRKKEFDDAKAERLPFHRPNLNPEKVPRKISRSKEVRLKMVCGEDLIFCTIPKVQRFNMTNVNGQEKGCHRVELTYPYWMTKYPITVKQWRDFGVHDCEGYIRLVESAFRKSPVCISHTYARWEKFCEFLNKRYGELLPEGYVFRIPTEAEWEWALVADEKGTARNISRDFRPVSQESKDRMDKILKRNKTLQNMSADGMFANVYVGGRATCNAFGVCDMLHSKGEVVFDMYTADDLDSRYGGRPDKNILYDDYEKDPVHWDGRLSNKFLVRGWQANPVGRSLFPHIFGEEYLAHIVVAPDIETGLRQKELADYPQKDFGGEFIGNMAKVYRASSSVHEHGLGTERAQKRMLTLENVRVPFIEEKDRVCGVMTKSEPAPWIQIELEKKMQITGIHIESYMHSCKEIRVWVSDDGVREREVFKDERNIRLYRVNLSKKNVKAKYIRIGREPATNEVRFCLNKILVYGK